VMPEYAHYRAWPPQNTSLQNECPDLSARHERKYKYNKHFRTHHAS